MASINIIPIADGNPQVFNVYYLDDLIGNINVNNHNMEVSYEGKIVYEGAIEGDCRLNDLEQLHKLNVASRYIIQAIMDDETKPEKPIFDW